MTPYTLAGRGELACVFSHRPQERKDMTTLERNELVLSLRGYIYWWVCRFARFAYAEKREDFFQQINLAILKRMKRLEQRGGWDGVFDYRMLYCSVIDAARELGIFTPSCCCLMPGDSPVFESCRRPIEMRQRLRGSTRLTEALAEVESLPDGYREVVKEVFGLGGTVRTSPSSQAREQGLRDHTIQRRYRLAMNILRERLAAHAPRTTPCPALN